MKQGDKRQVDIERAKVWATILYLANTFTGARFEKPLSIDQNYIIDASTDLVFNYFSMLTFDELKIAFEMAVANRLKDVNIETYYGKFTAQTLSTVLNAYVVFRKGIQAELQRIEDERKKEKSEEEIQERNRQTIQDVKKQYQILLDTYKLTGEFDKEEIKPFWGKILVEQGIINFAADEKKQIYEEAKEIVTNEIKSELGTNEDMMLRKSLINLLSDIERGNSNEDFISKSKTKYGYLIVVKSILNSI